MSEVFKLREAKDLNPHLIKIIHRRRDVFNDTFFLQFPPLKPGVYYSARLYGVTL